jgi:hypothetical protein
VAPPPPPPAAAQRMGGMGMRGAGDIGAEISTATEEEVTVDEDDEDEDDEDGTITAETSTVVNSELYYHQGGAVHVESS